MVPSPAPRTSSRIGDILLEHKIVRADQLQAALDLADREGRRLGEALVLLGAIDSETMTWALGVQFNLTYVDLFDGMIDWPFLMQFPLDRLRQLLVLPIAMLGGSIRAVIADPTIAARAAAIQELFGKTPVLLQLSSPQDIARMLELAISKGKELAAETAQETKPRPDSELERWIAALATGELERVVVMPASGGGVDATSIPFPAIADYAHRFEHGEVEQMGRMLGRYFTASLPVPGGFCGLRPGRASKRHRTIRAVSLMGARGRLVALESMPIEFVPRERSPLFLLAGPSQRVIKAALFKSETALFPETKGGEQSLLLALESRVEFSSDTFFQAELPDARARLTVAPHIMSAAQPRVTLLEIEPGIDPHHFASLAYSLKLGPAIVVLHAETAADLPRPPDSARVAFIPGEIDEARAAVREALAG